MADGKKKLVIKTTGAGDPTFITNFRLESDEVPTIFMKAQVTLLDNSVPGQKGDTFGFSANFPVNQDFLMGKAFPKTDQNDSPQAAADTSSTLEFLFYEDDNETVEDTFEVVYASLPILATKAVNFSKPFTAVLHYTSHESDGNQVFLYLEDNLSLIAKPSFISLNNYRWTISSIPNTAAYSIFAEQQQVYLGVDAQGNLVLSNTSPDKNTGFYWLINSVVVPGGATGAQQNTVYKVQSFSNSSYLAANPATGEILISAAADNYWYFHIPPTN